MGEEATIRESSSLGSDSPRPRHAPGHRTTNVGNSWASIDAPTFPQEQPRVPSGQPSTNAAPRGSDASGAGSESEASGGLGSKPTLGTGARIGRRVGQVALFGALVWLCASATLQIVREAFFSPVTARNSEQCRAELASLRARLADASLAASAVTDQGEMPAVHTFRDALGGPAGRDFDQAVGAVIDGCPEAESRVGRALGRLRSTHEAMVRLDAHEGAPARLAHKHALAALGVSPSTTPPPKSAP
jgi:hypothetical protein